MGVRGTEWEIVDWVYLAQYSSNCPGFFVQVMNLRISMKCWEFLDEMWDFKLKNDSGS